MNADPHQPIAPWRGARVVAAALWGSLVSATIPLGASNGAGFALAVGLMLPVALALALLASRVLPAVYRLGARLSPSPVRVCALLQVPLSILLGGIFATNLLVADSPFGPHAKRAYGLTLFAALVLTFATHRLTRRAPSRVPRWSRVIGVTLLLDGLGAGLLDSYGIRQEYRIHGLLLWATLAACTGAAYALLPRRPYRWLGGGALVTLVALAVWVAPDRAAAYRRALVAHTPHAEALLQARALLDRDRDGFSPWLGGGDCDDRDRTAYPLSPTRDCLGWRSAAALAPPTQVSAPPAEAPRVILLLTIDAFRCGFGQRGEPPLRDGCPRLRQLAEAGRAQLDAHTAVPSTAWSMAVLMAGTPAVVGHSLAGVELLPQRLSRLGFRSELLVTFPQVIAIAPLATALGRIDRTLESTSTTPFRGDALTTRTLARVRAALADSSARTFVWAHYPDLHFPFVVDDGPWKHGGVEDYALLLKRTDAAIGRLADQLSQLPQARDLLVVITADHGEEFGEHGERYHGFTLYEEGVRVPIIVWSPVTPRRFGAPRLPHQLADLASYLESAAGKTAPRSRADVLMQTVTADHQLAVISHGWKLIYNQTRNRAELYDLGQDPEERHDLAPRRPDLVERLGHRLGAQLALPGPPPSKP